jgi:epsilon-lactone hydrolase
MIDVANPVRQIARFGEARARALFVLTAVLAMSSWLGLAAMLRFPDVLLDPPSFATAVVRSRLAYVVLSLLGLLVCGVLVAVLAQRTTRSLFGIAGGASWCLAALLGMVLLPLWAGGRGAPVVSWAAFALVAVLAPMLLAVWTFRIGRRQVLGVLGALGLALVAVRSCIWVANALLPRDRGLYLTSAVLTTAALVGFPLWPAWLLRRAASRALLAGLLAPVVALVYAAATIASAPAPRGAGAPAVPSAAGSAFYLMAMTLPALGSLPTTEAELRVQRSKDLATPPQLPSGATIERLDADGVPSERICADGASTDRMVLYLPGGGFISVAGNGPRRFAAAISRQTGVCVLLAHYRLAPESPYPAGREDGVRAYRWLRQQGLAPTRIAIVGDSAGGNLALTTALALRAGGDALPAALVSVSGVADLTLEGRTFRTLSDRDPILTPGTRKLTADIYTRRGALDPRDPLMSPLYADPTDLPPTLLMVGTQEVLLSDIVKLWERFRAAGVPGELQVWPGMLHAWPLVAEEAPESRMAIAQIAAFLAQNLAPVR